MNQDEDENENDDQVNEFGGPPESHEEEEDGPPESDIPSMEDDGDSERARCPKTNEPCSLSPKSISFQGFPDLACWNEVNGRKMEDQEYVDALRAHMEKANPPILTGFISKEKKRPYSAGLQLVEDGTKWAMWYPPAEESSHNCPKTGKPIQIRETYYMIEGFPKGGFFKTVASREMSVPDYLAILESGADGVEFRDFKTKAGKKFDGTLVYDAAEGKCNFKK